MNKYQEYQEALNNICCGCYGGDEGCNGKDKYCTKFLSLQELVNQQKTYTEEEIEKMWEELGYVFKRTIIEECGIDTITLTKEETKNIQGQTRKEDVVIIIYVNNKKFAKVRYPKTLDEMEKCAGFFTFEELQLLTKTFKACEVENAKN